MKKLILLGLQKNFKQAIIKKDKKLMKFVKEGFYSVKNDYKDELRDRIEKNINMCEFFLNSYRWN